MNNKNHHNHEGHDHLETGNKIAGKLTWALIITIALFVAELIGGIMTNSLSLKSDAGHLFGDVLALGLSLFAARIALLPPSSKRTYGYHRVEVLAAVFNGVTLFVLAGYIFYEAYQRLIHPEPVKSAGMLIIAIIGLAGNLFVMMKLHGSSQHNLNVRAAYLHVVGDMLGSVGVVAGGLIMIFSNNYLADPLISFFIGAIILYGAFGVLREGANILLEGMPVSIKYKELMADLESLEGVVSIHDLHVWTISSSNLSLSAHVKIPDQLTHSSQQVLQKINDMLQSKYNIYHTTIQLECDCCEGVECGCGSPI